MAGTEAVESEQLMEEVSGERVGDRDIEAAESAEREPLRVEGDLVEEEGELRRQREEMIIGEGGWG